MKLKKFLEMNVIKQDKDVLSYGPEEDDFANDENFHEFPEEEDIVPEDVDYEDVEDDDVTQDDVVESLLSTLRKMIRNANFERTYVFTDSEGCINIQFVLNKTEKIARVMKVMNLLKKLESDILIQYDSEFELWETKTGDPLLTAKFFYDENVSSSDDDDDDDDDDDNIKGAPF
jgi:hypothetical protein